MRPLSSKILIGSMLMVLFLAAAPAPAAAHDPGCLVSAHLGPAQYHYQCDPKNRGDTSNCLFSFNLGPIHDDLFCE